MKTNTILLGDALENLTALPSGKFQCCVTSPPYYQQRDYHNAKQMGLEKTPERYVRNMVRLFREVRRVLRDDGTLFLNIGDSYRDKNLVGIPWMLAFALRADGWYLRQDLIWAKPNGMVESIEDRCTKAHEYVFLLSKSPRYFFDYYGIQEPSTNRESYVGVRKRNVQQACQDADGVNNYETRKGLAKLDGQTYEFRNARSVWWIPVGSVKEAHFATMPAKLAERCIRAGTSEKGKCFNCGTPWVRRLKQTRIATRPGADTKVNGTGLDVGNRDPERNITKVEMLGWKAGCDCGRDDTKACLILDCFGGSGTTAIVAEKLGRRWVLIELNEKYAAMAERRIARAAASGGLGLTL
jgi:DNA modification methylase